MSVLQLIDGDEPVEFGFPDLRKYHGSRSICGLTVAFKVMQRAFVELAGSELLQRDSITVTTAFPGAGARDAFELVTRAPTRDRYSIDNSIEPSDQIAEAAKGAYFFRLSGNGRYVDLGLRPSMIEPEFIHLRRKHLGGSATDEELTRFRILQHRMSSRLLSLPAEDVVNRIDGGVESD